MKLAEILIKSSFLKQDRLEPSYNAFFQLPLKTVTTPTVIFLYESHDSKASTLTLLNNLTFLQQMGFMAYGFEKYLDCFTPHEYYELLMNIIEQFEVIKAHPHYPDITNTDLSKLTMKVKEQVPWYQPGRGCEEALQLKADLIKQVSGNTEFDFFAYDISRDDNTPNVEIAMAKGVINAVERYEHIVVNVGAGHAEKILAEIKSQRPDISCINFYIMSDKLCELFFKKWALPADTYFIVDDQRFQQDEIDALFQRIITERMQQKAKNTQYTNNYNWLIKCVSRVLEEAHYFSLKYHVELKEPSLNKILEHHLRLEELKKNISSEINNLLSQDASKIFRLGSGLKVKLMHFLWTIQSVDYMPLRYATMESNTQLGGDDCLLFRDVYEGLAHNTNPQLTNLKNLMTDFQINVNLFGMLLFDDSLIVPKSNKSNVSTPCHGI